MLWTVPIQTENRRRRSRFLPSRPIRQKSAGGCLDARNQKEVSGAAYYRMEILFWHLDFARHGRLPVSDGEPRCPRIHHLHHLIENSLQRLSLRMSVAAKSRPINSRPSSRRSMRPSPASANRHAKARSSERPRCRSVDPFTAIMSSAWIAAGAGRCLGGTSPVTG